MTDELLDAMKHEAEKIYGKMVSGEFEATQRTYMGEHLSLIGDKLSVREKRRVLLNKTVTEEGREFLRKTEEQKKVNGFNGTFMKLDGVVKVR